MKKLILATLLTGTALSFTAAAHAEGEAAIRSDTQFNASSGSSSPADNSVARGSVTHNDANDSITATSTTGTAPGTASATVDASGNVINAQTGVRDGDDDANPRADAVQVNDDMTTKAGTMKTRAKGAMGMLNPVEIKQIQQNLKQAGYNVSADGVYGPNTRKALEAYQKSNNLPVTGLFDADTRASFEASADRSNTDTQGNNN